MRFILPALLLVGCASPVDLSYAPPPSAASTIPRPLVADVRVKDERGMDPRAVGAIMGTDGKPFNRLQTDGPAADAVARAFRDALASRGELAPAGSGRYDLEVTVRALDGEQWAERQGAADLELRLIDRATGRAAYTARTAVESRGDNYLAYDNFELGSPAALGRVAQAALNRAIDASLDRSGFLLALR